MAKWEYQQGNTRFKSNGIEGPELVDNEEETIENGEDDEEALKRKLKNKKKRKKKET